MIRLLLLYLLFTVMSRVNCEEVKPPEKILSIELTKHNLITLRGVIDDEITADLVRKMNKFIKPQLYLYITSPGGSVMEGLQIIDQIKTLSEKDVKVICIADFAASMAFAIFQSCPIRYVTSSSILMQHQMSLGIKGNLYNLENYLEFVKQMDNDLDMLQSIRLGLEINNFKNKIMNDWWMGGKSILSNNAADKMVVVNCNSELVDQVDEINKITPIVDVKVSFSKCPISREPVGITIKTKIDYENENQSEIKNQIEQINSNLSPSKFMSKLMYNFRFN